LRVVGVNSGLVVIVVTCPLVMFFMMRNVGGKNHEGHSQHGV